MPCLGTYLYSPFFALCTSLPRLLRAELCHLAMRSRSRERCVSALVAMQLFRLTSLYVALLACFSMWCGVGVLQVSRGRKWRRTQVRHKHDTNNMDHFRWEPATQVTSVGQRKAIDQRVRIISGSDDDFAMIRPKGDRISLP